MKLLYNGSDYNSGLLYMWSDQSLDILLYNKVERKVRLLKYEQWKASGQNSRLKHIIEIYSSGTKRYFQY